MDERRLVIERQLIQLEVEKAGIEHAINEIRKRFALLDEVESWDLLGLEESSPDSLAEPLPESLPSESRCDGYDNQESYEELEEAVSHVPAGDWLVSRPRWTQRPLVA